ncbi:MAG: hypothetical protein WC700_14420 [Gemmatimonadaceae bacterium]|jgi:hypothetical protein
MNPKLRAALKAKAPKPDMTPKSGSPGTPSAEVGVVDAKGADYHHEQVRRHLEKGLSGTRRAAKIHMKMAKYHHDCACGMTHASK